MKPQIWIDLGGCTPDQIERYIAAGSLRVLQPLRPELTRKETSA